MLLNKKATPVLQGGFMGSGIAGIQRDHLSYSIITHFSSLISPASVDWPSLTMSPSLAALR